MRVWLTDGTDLALCGGNRNLTVGAIEYVAGAAPDASDIEFMATIEVSNLDIEGPLASTSITAAELRIGRWDNAKILLSLANPEHPEYGAIPIQKGWLGKVWEDDTKFRAEFRSLKSAFKAVIVENVISTCLATLGDARCKVVFDGSPTLVVTGTVDEIDTDNVTIHDETRTEPPHPSGTSYFIGGKLTWLTGANAGLSMEIREATEGVIQLGLAMPYEVLAGDTYQLTPGCSKLVGDCKATFDNIVNFRGFPHLGGNNLLVQQGRK
jgi:uncharacterized phage protein (TIGR02218 family)